MTYDIYLIDKLGRYGRLTYNEYTSYERAEIELNEFLHTNPDRAEIEAKEGYDYVVAENYD